MIKVITKRHGRSVPFKDAAILQRTMNRQKVLSSLPDHAAEEIKEGDVQKYEVVRVADEIVIDLMAKACGIDFETAKKDLQLKEVEGVNIPVASKELLIRMKDTIRLSDKFSQTCGSHPVGNPDP